MKNILGAAFLLIVVALANQVAAASGPIKLGLNYPSTGRFSSDGIAEAQGAMLAVEEINQNGGMEGRPIELITANTASQPEKAIDNVRQMAKQGVSMVFGGVTSTVTIAAGKEAAQHGLLYFGTLSYANQTTGEEAHRYMFRECHNSWMMAKSLAGYLLEHHSKDRIGYITADYSWGWSTESSLRGLSGTADKVVHPSFLLPFPKPRHQQMAETLDAVLQSGVDTLVITLGGQNLVAMLRMIKNNPATENLTLIATAFTLGMARNAGPYLLDGVIGTVPWSWNIPYELGYEKGQRFVEAYVQKYDQYPSSPAASAYNIVYQYKDAVERAGTLDTDSVIKALEGHRYTALKDEQVWRAFDHQNVQSVYLVKGRPRNEVIQDKYRENFFQVLQSFRGDELVRSYDEWKAVRTKAGKPTYLE
ncbi:ABC transporter substrate-binding protein [Oceanobacter antarcticus]|uniref:ABC transporter substrate-binding protein n=1 Tax=Oceanobacter antarcticus TaxID=3133425 RepID=A0ABW8NKM0_9GAMM